MSRNVIIGTVVAVLVVGGAAAYWLTRDNEPEDSTASNTNQNQTNNTPSFNAASTEGKDFIATITTSGVTGETTFEYDVESSAFRYVANAGGQAVETITTPEGYFTKVQDKWIKYPVSAETQGQIDPNAYQYNQQEIAAYSGASNYEGRQSCSAGSCDVWRTSSQGAESKLFIAADTGYIVRVETTIDSKTSSINYDYKDVTITPPTDFQELPSFN